MKKLMTIVATFILALAVNAAAVNWECGPFEYANETTIDQGTYWLVSLGSSTNVSDFKVFEDGTYNFGTGTVVTSGTITDAFFIVGEISGLYEANNGTYYALVAWDGKNVANGGLWGVSDASQITGIADNPPKNGEAIIFKNGTDSYGDALFANQNVAPVPEPTALALLALGVAGLALRRRA